MKMGIEYNRRLIDSDKSFQPNFVETDANGDAVIYALISSYREGELLVAITDADAGEPVAGDAAWVPLSDIYGE